MRQSLKLREIPLGRIAGIPISASWSVLGIAMFVIYSLAFNILPTLFPSAPLVDRLGAATASAFLFVLSILGHELGHAFLAKRHGVEVDGISLWILGGVAKLNRHAPTPRAEFEIAIAGPFASLLIGLGFSTSALVARSVDIYGPGPAVLTWLGVVNVVLAVSNLLPAAPLDGGRVLTAALWRKNGDAETARLQSARCGVIAGVALLTGGVVATVLLGQSLTSWSSAIIMGVFFLFAARAEVLGAAARRSLTHTEVGSLMTHHPAAVPGTTTLASFAVWAGEHNAHIAFPVVRHGFEPVGYVSVRQGARLELSELSWTPVADVMIPVGLVPRAWDSESADTVLRRLESSYPMAVVHDVQTNRVVGTVTLPQLHALIGTSDWWGREAEAISPTVVNAAG